MHPSCYLSMYRCPPSVSGWASRTRAPRPAYTVMACGRSRGCGHAAAAPGTPRCGLDDEDVGAFVRVDASEPELLLPLAWLWSPWGSEWLTVTSSSAVRPGPRLPRCRRHSGRASVQAMRDAISASRLTSASRCPSLEIRSGTPSSMVLPRLPLERRDPRDSRMDPPHRSPGTRSCKGRCTAGTNLARCPLA